ncbi:hypothetical protein FRX31_005042 [Thalictrum thalictroides]|uniref:Uncharacterized protein n=1 Tax=Thalictrum thalictroides TaxID=46969 RepID=A0A7J6XAE9_THATH|nr:hypothetical protein FRX31_005042 [Thalictrum thalictroides]
MVLLQPFSVEEDQPWKILGKLLLLQPFSVDGDPFAVRFTTIPLSTGLQGLSLEHHTTPIVKFIASAAGKVLEILPKETVPRTSEGYRVKIIVKVFEPLIQGTPVNTVHQGIIWVD